MNIWMFSMSVCDHLVMPKEYILYVTPKVKLLTLEMEVVNMTCLIKRKERKMLVSQIVEFQSTLSNLSLKVDNIKLEIFKLHLDNEVLVQYIKNFVCDFYMTY
nr:unnamed protein product [Callosobruchus chinensis]